jgi:hypothetical protein
VAISTIDLASWLVSLGLFADFFAIGNKDTNSLAYPVKQLKIIYIETETLPKAPQ